jgi:hypothetical protein
MPAGQPLHPLPVRPGSGGELDAQPIAGDQRDPVITIPDAGQAMSKTAKLVFTLIIAPEGI